MKEMRELKSRYEFSLDNRQVALIISGLILVLMLSFLMGTLFGRNLVQMQSGSEVAVAAPAPSPGQEAAPLAETAPGLQAAAEPASASEPTALAASSITENEVKATALRDDLIRRLESEKVPTEAATGTSGPALASPVMGKPAEPAAADKTASSPEAKPAEKPAEETVSRPVVPAGSYTIQLASLPSRADADALLADLRGKKFDAYMLQVSLDDKGTFYRVRLGHYKDLEQARKALLILQSREGKYQDAWITQ